MDTPAKVLAWGPVIGLIFTFAERIADRVQKRRAIRRIEDAQLALARVQQKKKAKETRARQSAPTRRVKPVRDPQR